METFSLLATFCSEGDIKRSNWATAALQSGWKIEKFIFIRVIIKYRAYTNQKVKYNKPQCKDYIERDSVQQRAQKHGRCEAIAVLQQATAA